MPGEDAVAGRRQRPEDDVARLLAPEAQAVGVERGQDVAVPHVRLAHRDAAVLHGEAEAEVGHDRHHNGVAAEASPLGQVEGEQREEDVAVDDRAVLVHRDDPVGVAVEGEPEVGLVRDDGLGQFGRVGRAALVVDVGAVGRDVQGGHRRAELGQDTRRDGTGGAVGAVDDDAQPVETPALNGVDEMVLVVRHRVGIDGDHPHTVSGGTAGRPLRIRHDRIELAFDLPLEVDGQLRPQQAEELDAVIAEGVVRGRDDGAGGLAQHGHRGDARGGEHTEVDDVGPLRGEAGGEGGLEQRARAARVAADHEGRGGEDAGGGAAEGQRQLGGQLLVGNSAHAIGTETGRRHRRPAATAWSTAAPCEPSSGRTSWTPSRGRRG